MGVEKLENLEIPLSKGEGKHLELSAQYRPSSYSDYRIFLYSLYRLLGKQWKAYNYKKFASDLGLSDQEFLRNVMQGDKKLNKKQVETIVKALAIQDNEAEYFRQLVLHADHSQDVAAPHNLVDLFSAKLKAMDTNVSEEQLQYFSEWYIPTIGELINLTDGRVDAAWVSENLNPKVAISKVKKALKVLKDIGIVSYDKESDSYQRSGKDLSTAEEIKTDRLNYYIRQMIDLGKDSLHKTPKIKREVSSVTVSVNEELAMKIKNLIQDFESEVLVQESLEEDPDRLYQLNIQFFPVSEPIKKGRKKNK